MQGLKRSGYEKFYTKQCIVKDCVLELQKIYPLEGLVVEPSAGAGAFLNVLEKIPSIKKILAYDILPECNGIIEQDFLKLNTVGLKDSVVIGNPPFGRQSSLAKKFIKKCCEFANVIAFILPRSFKKESMHTCFSLNFHKVFEKDLPLKAFTIENQDCSIPCIFQIWKKMETKRSIPIKYKVNDKFSFVKNPEDSNFAFKRVGGNAGNFVFENLNLLSIQSHYFIKSDYFTKETLRNLKFETDNTTGPKSISKQELIKALNSLKKYIKL